MTIGIGVIGYGYWGPNLVRNFSEAKGAKVVAVSDLRQDRLDIVSSRYPGVATTRRYQDLMANPAVDVIAVATAVSTHYELTMEALKAGKHVFVEKPMASTADECARMIEEAAKRSRVLAVDHTFVYTGAVRYIRDMVMGNKLGGEIYYYDSVRINLGLFQHDVNVIWDLAVHDVSIMDYVLPAKPVSVSATGMSHVSGQPENIAYLTLFFQNNLIAHLHVNWLAPVKIRRMIIGGNEKMLVYDDLEPSEKIKIYDKGVTLNTDENRTKLLFGYRAGDMWAPQIDLSEALKAEVRHFLDCVEKNQNPLTDGEAGMQVVRVLERATQSLSQRGKLISL